MTVKPESQPACPGSREAGQPPEPEVLSSEALLKDRREVLILHQGEHYRLRRTRQDKLILTK